MFILEERFAVPGCSFIILASSSANLSYLFLENTHGDCASSLKRKKMFDELKGQSTMTKPFP
jgi:hypothetical protein